MALLLGMAVGWGSVLILGEAVWAAEGLTEEDGAFQSTLQRAIEKARELQHITTRKRPLPTSRPPQRNVVEPGVDWEEIARLESMGYMQGTMPARRAAGVLQHDKARAYQGLNFYVSGHAPEAILMDMQGNVLHKWGYDFFDAWPDRPVPRGGRRPTHWRRAYLYPNGDLLAIYGGYGLVKLDKDSKLLWGYEDNVHHDLDVREDGTIYTLVRKGEWAREVNARSPVIVDYVVVLDENGKEQRRISILECFKNSWFAPMVYHMQRTGEVLHTNTIEVLDGRHAGKIPAFKEGNILVCMRDLDMAAVLDPQTRKAAWGLFGRWRRPHEPVLLDNGHMLIFDNRGVRRGSRILEFDPATQEVSWQYGGKAAEYFFSGLLGSVQRLPNQNTLITESENGRAFEVTPGHQLVWEFVSPHRAWDKPELVASLFEVVRLAPDFPHDWADPQTASLSIDLSRFRKAP